MEELRLPSRLKAMIIVLSTIVALFSQGCGTKTQSVGFSAQAGPRVSSPATQSATRGEAPSFLDPRVPPADRSKQFVLYQQQLKGLH